MIYLIRSACFKNINDINCNEYETILKIGYTRDDRASVRLATYRTENPGAIPIYSIPGGTEQDEKNLHNHFKKYLKYGQEWFSYEQEILEFFKTHTTKESLKELKIYHGNRNSRSFNKYRKERNRLIPELSRKYISKVLSSLEVSDKKYLETIELLQEKLNELLENSLDLDIVDDYFKLSYPNINFSEDHVLDSDVSKVIDEIENKYINFTDKMKYIYSLDFDSKFMKLILDNLSDSSYAKYYYCISKERAGTLGYQRGNLEKEYRNQKSNKENVNQVIEDIKSKFQLGERYSKVFIKSTLKDIYESNGYNKTPKASDLEEFFELKSCLLTNKETGKRDNGYEIIKEKS